MIPVGQEYRPAGPIDVRAVLTTLILGAFTAVIAAVPIWLWEISPIPTLLIVSTLIQGMILGVVFKFMVGRLRMRTPRLVGAIALACGLGSVLLVHYGHYLYFVNQAAAEIRQNVEKDPTIPAAQKPTILQHIDKNPFKFVDAFLAHKTGRGGFLGFLQMRSDAGMMLSHTPISGIAVWILWGVEALFAAWLTYAMAADRAGKPFCEDCGYWCHPEPDVFILPGLAAEPLAEAVRSDNPTSVVEIRRNPPRDTNSGMVGVTLHACPACDQTFADLWQQVSDGKKTVTTMSFKALRVSPQVADALRHAPAAADVPEHPPIETEDVYEGDPSPEALP